MMILTFSGYMTRDPEVVKREVREGRENLIVRLAVAHTDYWQGRDGVRKERTTYVELTAFASEARYISNYLRKGSYVAGTAKPLNNKYEKDGVTVNTYNFNVLEIEAPKLKRDSNGNDAPPHASAGRIGGIDDEIPF
jgi:single-stranded DNA-binding protein